MVLNKNCKIFVIYVIVLEVSLLELLIPLYKKAQIAFLLIKKVMILDKYLDFANVFSKKKALVLPEQTGLNKYTIKLKGNKQLLYRPI